MKLNLGCASDYREGYINVEKQTAFGKRDMTIDLDILPWPFKNESVDEVLMRDTLEHLTFPDKQIREVRRILKPGGRFWGQVPYAFSDGAMQALEHRWMFTEKSFDFLCQGRPGAEYLGKPSFIAEYIRLATVNNTPKTRLRNLIPFRSFLRHWLRNMYDEVEFSLVKI